MLQDKIRMAISVLDRHNPDWHWRVNLDELAMEYDCSCILGQLYGSYEKGKCKLNINSDQAYKLGFLSWWQKGSGWLDWLPFVGRRLTRAWRKAVINKRQCDDFEYNIERTSRSVDVKTWDAAK